MELKAFYQRSTEIIANLQETELRLALHNLARKTPKPAREGFLQLLEDSFVQAGPARTRYQQLLAEDQVEQTMAEIEEFFLLLNKGEIYLTAQGYEDYSHGWDSDWIYEYSDEKEIGSRLENAINFAHQLLYDCRYKAALRIFDLAWAVEITAQDEGGDNLSFDFAELVKEDLLCLNLQKMALATLYACYQTQPAGQRAAAIYQYFAYPSFAKIKIEDILTVGREELEDQAEFFQAWITYLKQQSGDLAARLLQEASLFYQGQTGLVDLALENFQEHPSLFLSALEELKRNQAYSAMLDLGLAALALLDPDLKIRSRIALLTSQAAARLKGQPLLQECWYEAFRSDSTPANLLRLFSDPAVDWSFHVQAKARIQQLDVTDLAQDQQNQHNLEQARNMPNSFMHKQLTFFAGDFASVKNAMTKKKAVGWGRDFTEHGLDLFLLLLYADRQLGKAGQQLAQRVTLALNFADPAEAAAFWPSFLLWKAAHPLAETDKESYLAWLDSLIAKKADAIVSGKYTREYASGALLVAALGEVCQSWGRPGGLKKLIDHYQALYPRHSAWRRELRVYLDQ